MARYQVRASLQDGRVALLGATYERRTAERLARFYSLQHQTNVWVLDESGDLVFETRKRA